MTAPTAATQAVVQMPDNERAKPVRSTEDVAILVRVANRANMERQLDEAVASARMKAMTEGLRGILVTRLGFDTFSVALSDDVPFGQTRESQDWHNAEVSSHSAGCIPAHKRTPPGRG